METLPTNIHRFLISTTSQLIATYDSPHLRIDHAFPSTGAIHRIRQGITENPYSRNYFVLSININEPEEKSVRISDYSYECSRACVLLSILYGKRFDNHGALFSHGSFRLPELIHDQPESYFDAAPYNHKPRRDINTPLDLRRFSSVAALLEEPADPRFIDILFAAGRFYLRSLQVFCQEPEFAYLDLVTCGEIMSNYYEYSLDSLLDRDTKNSLEKVREEIEDGARIERQLKSKMRQVKRAYTLTLLGLLNDTFFTASECAVEWAQLKQDSIEKRLKASYDLRSLYVHTGINFGHWMHPHHDFNEVQYGKPLVGNDKNFAKALELAPTFLGLERIMRYCLLRFIHLKGIPIDPALDDFPSATAENEA